MTTSVSHFLPDKTRPPRLFSQINVQVRVQNLRIPELNCAAMVGRSLSGQSDCRQNVAPRDAARISPAMYTGNSR